MMLSLDQTEEEELRDALTTRLNTLRFEIAHADARRARQDLHAHEQAVEGLLAKLDREARSSVR